MRFALVLLAIAGSASVARAQEASEVRSFGYARLGYGSVAAESVRHAPAIGFGFRGEVRSWALDVSLFNYVIDSGSVGASGGVFAGSLLKLEALRFHRPDRDASAYYGLGLSWGVVNAGRPDESRRTVSDWHGSGLQGEATVGYEFTRTSPMRAFVQADLGLPLFRARSEDYEFAPAPGIAPRSPTVTTRYIPSALVSLGIGWQRRRP